MIDLGQCIIEARCTAIQVAGTFAKLDSAGAAFNNKNGRARHCRGKRLRPTHSAQAGAEEPAPREGSREVATPNFTKRLICPLHNALGTDVDPGTCRHLAVHDESLAIEL